MRKVESFTTVIVAIALAVTAAADDHASLPLLVNIHAYPNTGDPQNEADYDFLKERFEKNVKDANRILDRAATNLGKNSKLRLGPITFERNTSGAQTVQQGTQGARDLVTEGQQELRTKQKNKGLKIYVVTSVKSSGGAEIDGMSDQGTAERPARVSWFPDGTFKVVPGADGLEGNSGQFLLHEIGHNAGMARTHVPAENGVHFMKASLGFLPDDRVINDAQWTELGRLFRRFGTTNPNTAQQGAFAPPATESHYAFVADPNVALSRPLDWLDLAIDDDGLLAAELAWKSSWNLGETINYNIAIGLDLDNSLATCDFPTYGPGIDGLVEVWVEHSPGFGPYVSGALSYYDPSFQYVSLQSIGFYDLGLTGADGDFDGDRNAIQLSHNVSMIGAPASTIPAMVLISEDSSPYSFSTTMLKAPRATLPSLPVTLEDNATIPVSGAGFATNATVDLFLDHTTSTSALPADSGTTDSNGAFSLPLTVDGVIAGDYVVTAMDDTGIIATGIVTLVGEIFADGFESGTTSRWSSGVP
jgi:hypothetical protein